jgi:hypothetical protein
VGGRRYEQVESTDGRQFVRIPGVAGKAGTDEIPERLARFVGAEACVEVQLKQANQFYGPVPVGEADGWHGFVGCLTGWSVALDGAVVYGGVEATGSAVQALLAAGAALPRLLALPFRVWEVDDWLGRAAFLDGRPCTVAHLLGNVGRVRLVPDEAGAFGPDKTDEEIDLLSDRIWWWPRPTASTETSPDE